VLQEGLGYFKTLSLRVYGFSITTSSRFAIPSSLLLSFSSLLHAIKTILTNLTIFYTLLSHSLDYQHASSQTIFPLFFLVNFPSSLKTFTHKETQTRLDIFNTERNPNSPRHLQHRRRHQRKRNRKEKRVIYPVKEFGKIGLHREIRWKQLKTSSLKRESSNLSIGDKTLMYRIEFAHSVKGKHRILLCPDKDADGLSSCLVLYRTLIEHLSHPIDLVSVYFLPKGINIHSEIARSEMLSIKFPSSPTSSSSSPKPPDETYTGPTRAIIMDQGSRPGPALLPPDKCPTLLIDHHQSSTFPESITVLSACQSEPVATTSILAYLLCCELVPSLKEDRETSMGALLGLYGDLGASKINLSDPSLPWPNWLAMWEKTLTKTKLSKATALLNAPRRTPEFNARIAWEALEGCKGELKGIMEDRGLGDAKERTSNETQRWQGAAPKFSKDGKVAVIKVDSGYQSMVSSLVSVSFFDGN